MFQRLEQWLCTHQMVWRTDDARLYLQCLLCRKETEGIITGGHTYKEAIQ